MCSFVRASIKKDCVVDVSVFVRIVVCARPLPHDFVLKVIFAKNVIEHHFDVMAGVPVTVIIKAAGLFEHTRQLFAARPHVINVSLGGFVAVVESPLLARFRPEDFVVAVGVERRVNVNEVHADVGQAAELFQAIAAVDDAGVQERGRAWLRS